MTDPDRKMDVEDVLASIRRLVSEQARNKDATAQAPQIEVATQSPIIVEADRTDAAVETPVDDEKLVLTQALRVGENPVAEPQEDVPHSDAVSRLAQRIADENDVVETRQDPDGDPTPLKLDKTDRAEDLAKDPLPYLQSGKELRSLQQAGGASELPPEISKTAVSDGTGPSPEETAEESDATGATDTPNLNPENINALDPVSDSEMIDATGAEALIDAAALKDTNHQDLEQASTEPETSEDEKSQTPEALALNETDDDFVENLAAPDDEFLDEDALRDLVTSMVRAELQGALGDRISRNVRKLVRREIQRALSSRDLE